MIFRPKWITITHIHTSTFNINPNRVAFAQLFTKIYISFVVVLFRCFTIYYFRKSGTCSGIETVKNYAHLKPISIRRRHDFGVLYLFTNSATVLSYVSNVHSYIAWERVLCEWIIFIFNFNKWSRWVERSSFSAYSYLSSMFRFALYFKKFENRLETL